MSKYIVIGCFSRIFNRINYSINQITRIYNDIYRIYSTKPTWYISNSGRCYNSVDLTIHDPEVYWCYDGSILSKGAFSKAKRLPISSGEFTHNQILISFDDFLENIKYGSDSPPNIDVIVSAFSLYSKNIYPWSNIKINIYDNSGEYHEITIKE